MTSLKELQHYVGILQDHFAEAFDCEDTEGMYETSYALTRAYAMLGNLKLAGRWATECERHTEDPTKLFAINLFLLCGIIKQKYLQNH